MTKEEKMVLIRNYITEVACAGIEYGGATTPVSNTEALAKLAVAEELLESLADSFIE